MTKLCIADTETTSLRWDRRAWEVGLIVREDDGERGEHQWFTDVRDLDLGNADPASLRIGRFYERHPQIAGASLSAGNPGQVLREDEIMRRVERLSRGAHIIGAVPNFDTEVFAARMRAHGVCWSGHYHLCDVENLAAGWLNAYAAYLEGDGTVAERSAGRAAELRRIAAPPWNSEELSRAVGVDPEDFERHSALGDCLWAEAIYDAVMGGPS